MQMRLEKTNQKPHHAQWLKSDFKIPTNCVGSDKPSIFITEWTTKMDANSYSTVSSVTKSWGFFFLGLSYFQAHFLIVTSFINVVLTGM